MEWRQEKDMPVFMYIFLNKIEDTEEVRWTEKEKSEGHKTYKKLLELADGDSSDVIKKCLRIIKETRHIVEYELWNKIVYFMTDYINGETSKLVFSFAEMKIQLSFNLAIHVFINSSKVIFSFVLGVKSSSGFSI